jgi:hypothetical protein
MCPRHLDYAVAARVGQWTMNNVTFETQDLRIRIEDKIARIDQRRLDGEPWTKRVADFGTVADQSDSDLSS